MQSLYRYKEINGENVVLPKFPGSDSYGQVVKDKINIKSKILHLAMLTTMGGIGIGTTSLASSILPVNFCASAPAKISKLYFVANRKKSDSFILNENDEELTTGDYFYGIYSKGGQFEDHMHNLNISKLNSLELEFLSKLEPIQLDNQKIIEGFASVKSHFALSGLKLGTIFASITNLNSIFFRASDASKIHEFKLEAFYDYDSDDSEDIEATLHIYKFGIKLEAHYGSIDYLFSIIDNISKKNIESYELVDF